MQPKLTPRRLAQLVKALELGVSRATATAAVGIHAKTLQRWLKWGRHADAGPYHDFAAAVEAVEARAQELLVQRVVNAGEKDWRASAWLLSRRWPEEYGTETNHIAELRRHIVRLQEALAN